MILNIDNLGIIKQAKIDFSKKFILFCGGNSTGKTYASYVIDAFIQNNDIFQCPFYHDIISQLQTQGQFSITKEYLNGWIEAKCKQVKNNISSIFGISDDTSQQLFSDFILSATYEQKEYENMLYQHIRVQMQVGQVKYEISKEPNDNIVKVKSSYDWSTQLDNTEYRSVILINHILRKLALWGINNTHMLTVERNSIYTFKTELSLSRNELIDQIQQVGTRSELDVMDMVNRLSRRYPLSVRNSLRIANDLENVSKYNSEFACVADFIETDLLLGEVSLTKNGDVEFRSQSMPKSSKLPFHLSSSIVKTMASLVVYLRYIANEGDMLIVDEPEMNFHPDVQILLARIFAMLSNKGLHVIVSTHSDYIVRELNNLIMAHSVKQDNVDVEIVNQLGYTNEMLLNQQDISVMYFNRKSKKVNVVSLDIDQYGFAVQSIDNAINQQNEAAERLYAHLIDKYHE